MTKVLLLAVVAIATAFSCGGANSVQPANTDSSFGPTPESPSKAHHESWKASFFKALEQRTKEVHLESLRNVDLNGKDLEARFWYDARPDIINGLVIRRRTDQWSGIGIRQIDNRWPSPVRLSVLGQPKSGWRSLWEKLVNSGLLTLPDSDQTKCHTDVLDGGAFVVETNVSGIYRIYRYSNPQLAICDEAMRVVSIESIIADEFGLHFDGKSK